MLLDVLIAACAALGAAGVLMALFKLFRAKPPRWMLPAVAAVAVVGVTATLRYQWADRTLGLLPAEMVLVERMVETTPFEPWSLVKPVTSRLIVADTASIKRNPDHPHMAMVDVLLLRRDGEPLVARHLVDCAQKRDAVLPAEPAFGADGLPEGLAWATDVPKTLIEAVCPAPEAEEPAAQPPTG